MVRPATVRAQVNPEPKHDAEAVFAAPGVSPAEAIRPFCRQVTPHRDLPLEARIPNAETRDALRRARAGEDLVEYADLDELKAAHDSAHAPEHGESV